MGLYYNAIPPVPCQTPFRQYPQMDLSYARLAQATSIDKAVNAYPLVYIKIQLILISH